MAVAQLLADGQALPQAGQRLVIVRLALVDDAEVAQAVGLAVAVGHVLADGEALVQVGQRLVRFAHVGSD